MERSYLIQRLKAPTQHVNQFSFGGGYTNGGLADDSMDLIRDIWSFDYMGSAEFEWGAVPKALNKISQNKGKYITSLFNVGGKDIYIIAHKDWIEEIEYMLVDWADGGREYRTKERVALDSAISGKYFNGPPIPEHLITRGWLELDNGYFFFIDEEMFLKTIKLFGIK